MDFANFSVCYSVLQCMVSCRVLQCVAVCCSMLQCENLNKIVPMCTMRKFCAVAVGSMLNFIIR